MLPGFALSCLVSFLSCDLPCDKDKTSMFVNLCMSVSVCVCVCVVFVVFVLCCVMLRVLCWLSCPLCLVKMIRLACLCLAAGLKTTNVSMTTEDRIRVYEVGVYCPFLQERIR